MARPFVHSMTAEQIASAAKLHDEYLTARREGSIKALAAKHGIKPLTMYRRLEAYKESNRVPCN